MSVKSFIQILILLLIISIVTVVYYKYFNINKNILEEINSTEIINKEQIDALEKKISELELKNNELNTIINRENEKSKIISNTEIKNEIVKNNKTNNKNLDAVNKTNSKNLDAVNKTNSKNLDADNNIDENKKIKKEENKELVKDIEYNSIDERGNNFYLLAKSGRSNINNKNALDLVDVRGEITSDSRDTIYIVSDFAQFNSVNSNSKFYDNVIINYQKKQITCKNFDINMETNKAIAYNDVIITDPNSEMKAGIVEFDLKTKNININPQSTDKDIKVVTN